MLIKKIPITASNKPTGVKSNIVNGVPEAVALKLATMMFGGVPIMVVSPPRREPKARGIINSPGARLLRRAICITTGNNKVSAPTLFIKPDKAATIKLIIAI